MSIDETITQLHSIIDNAKSFYTDDRDSEIWRTDVAACEMAIAALREKQEREKGCKYCNSEEGLAFYRSSIEYMGNGAKRFILAGVCEDGLMHIERKTVRKRTTSIDYLGKGEIDCCPKCGRKLREPSDDSKT